MNPDNAHDPAAPTPPGGAPDPRPGAIPASAHRRAETPRGDSPPPPPPWPGPRRLTRSRDDRVLAGVAGGLGRYFGVDPILFRLAFAVLVFAGGAGAIAYVAAWLFVPSDGRDAPPAGGSAGQVLARAALAVAVVAIAIVAALSVLVGAAFGGGPLIAAVILAAGLAMLIGGLLGARRARWLAIPALVLAVPLALVAAADFDLDGEMGDFEYRPVSVQELRDGYDLGMGELVLDLRGVRLPEGRTPLDLEVGMGRALVLVPDGVCVDTRVQIGAGHAEVFGRESGGMDLDLDWGARSAATSVPRLAIDAEIGAGELEVVRAGDLSTPFDPVSSDTCGTVA